MKIAIRALLSVLVLVSAASAPAAEKILSPSEFLGIQVGGDRVLADHRQIVSYFRALDAASPRVEVQLLGKSTLGEDLILAAISSEQNLQNLPRLREIARRIADPRGLGDAEAEALIREGKPMVLVTCSIHSSEVGAAQMSMEWAHALATAGDPETLRRLDRVVLLLVPDLNPDGLQMIADWYKKQMGTKYEGGSMPWLYQTYVGHDNNRDWFMLTQQESKVVSRMVYHEYFPQIWLDEHQMGSTGPRIFVPPYSEPVDPDIHPLVWREVNLIGSQMALRLEQAGKSGVIYGFVFDAYWPGGTKNTAWWKNISGLLTEVASVRIATPIRVEPGELSGRGKGLTEYGTQTNFPNPWPGGVWRLRDIMDYDRIASDALLEIAADRREDLLRDALARARAVIAGFGPGEAFRIPAAQRDPAMAARLAGLMLEHNVEVQAAADGDLWIPLAQPYGKFVVEFLEPQRYPEVRLVPGKDIVSPYDVSTWALPLMMGVTVERGTLPQGLSPYRPSKPALATEGAFFALAPGRAENAKLVNAALRAGKVSVARAAVTVGETQFPAGTVFVDAAAAKAAAAKAEPRTSWIAVPALPTTVEAMRQPRVGLYKPWAASMDEGWTRFLLETYGFDPKALDNKTVRAGKLGDSFDVIVIPDVNKDIIATGKPKPDDEYARYFTELPPEYAGGLDKEGAKALHDFVEAGGTLVALNRAADYVLGEFTVPVRNALSEVKPDEFNCPGTLLRVHVTPDHPVTYGLPAEVPIFLDEAVAFETRVPSAELERWVLAAYPAHAGDVLLSGWIRGEDRLTRKAAAVATTFGKGKLVFLGFRPQHRAQTPATFPLLFNALYLATSRGQWSVGPASRRLSSQDASLAREGRAPVASRPTRFGEPGGSARVVPAVRQG